MIYYHIHLMREIEIKFKNHKFYYLIRKISKYSFKTDLKLIFNQLLNDFIIRK